MKQKKKVVTILTYSILLMIIAGINNKVNFIVVPTSNEMADRQIDYITISTVFAGFSFTALGLLLGLSSEKLIDKIKNTSIIMDKVGRIVVSIVFFILSVVISLIYVLGLDTSIIGNENVLRIVDKFLYVLGIGYLIGGIAYFLYAVYELYDLIKRVYGYNKKEADKRVAVVKAEMEATRQKMREAEVDR